MHTMAEKLNNPKWKIKSGTIGTKYIYKKKNMVITYKKFEKMLKKQDTKQNLTN